MVTILDTLLVTTWCSGYAYIYTPYYVYTIMEGPDGSPCIRTTPCSIYAPRDAPIMVPKGVPKEVIRDACTVPNSVTPNTSCTPERSTKYSDNWRYDIWPAGGPQKGSIMVSILVSILVTPVCTLYTRTHTLHIHPHTVYMHYGASIYGVVYIDVCIYIPYGTITCPLRVHNGSQKGSQKGSPDMSSNSP